VGNAGTTLRFMLSLAALAQGTVAFEGSMRMAERPITDLLDALRMLGVHAEALEARSLYNVQGGSFSGGNARLRGNKSSQFLSSILMISSYAARDVTIDIVGELASKPYVDITLDVMRTFGVRVCNNDYQSFSVAAGQRYGPGVFHVEPDASGASYFLAAAAICGGNVTIEGLRSNSLQGDVRFLDVLRRMGCDVSEGPEGLHVHGTGMPDGIDIDMNTMPDVVPTLAVTALFGRGNTRISNIGHLRHKESDRLGALAAELCKLGACVTAHDDALEIKPAPLHGARLDTHDDHRLAMSFALVGLRVPGVIIENPDCVKKSFPTFWKEFDAL
jgi:3-phosphoshikimate 1-carboxyvinyltransferase